MPTKNSLSLSFLTGRLTRLGPKSHTLLPIGYCLKTCLLLVGLRDSVRAVAGTSAGAALADAGSR